MKIWTVIDYNSLDHFYIWTATIFIFVSLSAYYLVYPKLKALSEFSPFQKELKQKDAAVVVKSGTSTPGKKTKNKKKKFKSD